MGYMSPSLLLTDYDNDGTLDGLIRQLNIGTGLSGSLINGVLSLAVTGGGASIYDATITLTAGQNITGGGNFTVNQVANEEITFDGLSNSQIQALITAGTGITVSSGQVSLSAGINDLSDVTITSAATADILLYNGSAWVNAPPDHVFIRVKNDTGVDFSKGDVVYVAGPHNSNVADVELARANAASTMPAVGILYADLAAGAEGLAVAYGKVSGVALDPLTFSEGDTVYVSPTTAGLVTKTKPTGSTHLIQNVGIVMQTHATNGVLFVTGVGRVNDVPNTISILGGVTAGSFSTTGTAAFGDTTVTGKLTVTGLIDPTGLELTPVASNPGNVAANTIWQDSGNSNQWKIGANRVVDTGNLDSLTNSAGYIKNISGFSTDDLSQGSTNLYFSNSLARSAISVGTPAAASGSGSIGYVSGTGVLTYTPPDLTTYLTSETNDLTASVTWANVPDANITQSSVTQHQAALSITESQISDLGTYQTQNAILTDLAGLTQATDKLPYFDSGTTAATTTLTSFGRSLIDDADAATARATLGVDSAGTDNSTPVTLASVASNYLSLSGQQITAGTVPISLGGTGATTASAARTALGVDAAGTDNSTPVTLASVASNYLSLSGQQITAGTVPISLGGTGATTAANARTALGVDAAGTDNSTPVTLASVASNYLSLSGQEITAGTVPISLGGTGATTAANARTALGLAIGTNVQAYDADLTIIAGLSSADGNFIVGSATGWVVESGATARTSLGLGTAATTDTGDYATAAQGTLADSALQPGDNITELTNNAGYLTSYAETSTLDDVVGRGSSTTSTITVGGLTVDTNTLAVDTINNRVGVGTTSPKTSLTIEGAMTFKEQAAADADTAAYGQLWVKTATPNELYFTTDAGDDIQITTGTSLASGGGTVDFVSNVATNTILGRNDAGTGDSEELTPAEVRTMLNVEDGADVTDTANVTAAGALMDSEVTNLADVKSFDPADYAPSSPEVCVVNLATDVPNFTPTGAYTLLQQTGNWASPNPNFNTLTGLYTVPSDGVYRISWQVSFRFTPVGQLQASRIFVNGSTAAQGPTSSSGAWPIGSASALLTLSAGDTVGLYVYISTSGTTLVGDSLAPFSNHMSINKVSN